MGGAQAGGVRVGGVQVGGGGAWVAGWAGAVMSGGVSATTPLISTSGAESGSQVFKIRYFEKIAYLTQSPQLCKQMCVTGGLEKVCTITPIFRAQTSDTNRHLTQAISVDYEEITSTMEPVIDNVVKLLKYLHRSLHAGYHEQITYFNSNFKLQPIFVTKTYAECISMIAEQSDGDDISDESIAHLHTVWQYDYLIITHWPRSL